MRIFARNQNALIVRDAEQYYRAMFRRDHSSWNQRDTHMMRSLMALTDHLNKQRSPAKIIGVIYRPDTERASHYFTALLSDQFDAVLHFDHTRAVEPLERNAEWALGEVEETFRQGSDHSRKTNLGR